MAAAAAVAVGCPTYMTTTGVATTMVGGSVDAAAAAAAVNQYEPLVLTSQQAAKCGDPLTAKHGRMHQAGSFPLLHTGLLDIHLLICGRSSH